MHPTRPTEVPRAYVVRRTDLRGRRSSVAGEDISKFVCKRLASYKALDGGVVFVDDIPRTPSGKIQRFRLAKMDEYRSTVTEMLVKMNAPHADAAMGALKEGTQSQQTPHIVEVAPANKASSRGRVNLRLAVKIDTSSTRLSSTISLHL